MSLHTHRLEVYMACTRAAEYVLGRQCPDGGFCFYRTDNVNESNLADTYHALSVLRLLGRDVPRCEQVLSFLNGFPGRSQPDDLYHLTGIALLAHVEAPVLSACREPAKALSLALPPHRQSTEVSAWLTRAHTIVLLKRRLGVLTHSQGLRAIIVSLMHDGGFGPGPNLLDTFLAIEILAAHDVPLAIPGLARFIDELQHPSCGFTMTRTSRMERLELVAAGLVCCRSLKIPVRYATEALRFILACQTQRGGFAAAPDALPDIALTHQAVATLLALNALP